MKHLFTTLFLLSSLIALSQKNDSIAIKGITTEYTMYEDEKRLEEVTVNVYKYNTKTASYQTSLSLTYL